MKKQRGKVTSYAQIFITLIMQSHKPSSIEFRDDVGERDIGRAALRISSGSSYNTYLLMGSQ